MQTYKDSATGEIYSFEDDVVVSRSDSGVYSFTTSTDTGKVPLDSLPTTLQPYTVPTATDDELLVKARLIRRVELNAACAKAIAGGFTATPSTGNTYSYPSDFTSQFNISNSATNGGNLWCSSDAGASWNFVAHTADEATIVQAALFAMIQSNQKKYASYLTSVQAASTVDAVNAIVWSS